MKNRRPISLLNVDSKILLKAFSVKLKEVLPALISSEQTANVQNRFIAESVRLISDLVDICDSKKLSGFIATMDNEKAFDTLDHSFLIPLLKKFGFGQNSLVGFKLY